MERSDPAPAPRSDAPAAASGQYYAGAASACGDGAAAAGGGAAGEPDWFLAAVEPCGWGLPDPGHLLALERPFAAASRAEVTSDGRQAAAAAEAIEGLPSGVGGPGLDAGVLVRPAEAEAALERAVAAGAAALLERADPQRAWAVLGAGLLQVRSRPALAPFRAV